MVKRYWVDSYDLTDVATHTEPYCGIDKPAAIVVLASDYDTQVAHDGATIAALNNRVRELEEYKWMYEGASK